MTDRPASQAFLEPQSEMADKVNDKMEAYKQDKLEEQEKARILKESQVKDLILLRAAKPAGTV